MLFLFGGNSKNDSAGWPNLCARVDDVRMGSAMHISFVFYSVVFNFCVCLGFLFEISVPLTFAYINSSVKYS